MKGPSRAQVVQKYSHYLMGMMRGIEHNVKEAVDAGYVEGYNTVLEADEEVLSPEDYEKLIVFLDENGR